jgi:hypothetical protein
MTTSVIRKTCPGDKSSVSSSSKFHRNVKAITGFKSTTSKRIKFHGLVNEKQTAPLVNNKARQGWIIPANPRPCLSIESLQGFVLLILQCSLKVLSTDL